MNRCAACRALFTGHVACPQCGAGGYHDLNEFAGLVIRGKTAAHVAQIKATGAQFDGAKKEWIVPVGITSDQYDALTAVLSNEELRTGFYDNPADYETGPVPSLSQM